LMQLGLRNVHGLLLLQFVAERAVNQVVSI